MQREQKAPATTIEVMSDNFVSAMADKKSPAELYSELKYEYDVTAKETVDS